MSATGPRKDDGVGGPEGGEEVPMWTVRGGDPLEHIRCRVGAVL